MYDEIHRDMAMLGITTLDELSPRLLVPLGQPSREPVSLR
jgi:isopentenyl diphosphate isomerase/L-lactate dehydrogenase-like FMN-dependent dehydrogenase